MKIAAGTRRLIAALLLVAACLAVTSCGQRGEKFYTQAKSAYDKGDLAAAEVLLKQAVAANASYAPAYELLGRIQYRQRQFQAALTTLGKAVSLNPGLLDAQLTLGEVLLLLGRADEAGRKADLVLAKRQTAEALLLKAAVERARGQRQVALSWCRQAIAKDPARPEGYLVAAQLCGELNDLPQAEAVLKQGIGKVADSLPLQVSLAELYQAQRKPEEARKLISALVNRRPQDPKLRLMLAEYYLRQGKAEAGVAELKAAAALAPKDEAMRVKAAELMLAAGQSAEAEAQLKEALTKVQPGYLLRSRLARLYALTGRPAEAAAAYQAAIKLDPKRPEASGLQIELAALYLDGRKIDDALAQVNAVLARNPNEGRALLLKGKALLAKGDNAGATNAFKAAVQASPGVPEPNIWLAQAQAAAGQGGQAKATLAKALEVSPGNAQLRRALVRACLAERDVSGAKAQLELLLKADPKDAAALADLGGVHAAQGDMNQAAACFKRLVQLNPKDHLAYYRLGLVAAQQGKWDEAGRYLMKTYELQPDFGIAATGVVQTYLARKEPAKALAWVKVQVKARPQDPWLSNLLGELQGATGDMTGAEESFIAAQRTAAGWSTPYNNLIVLYARTGQMDQAVARFKESFQATRAPRSGQMLAMLQEATRDWAGARATYEQVLKIEPDFTLAANNLAFLLAEIFPRKDTLQEADRLVARTLAAAPGDPYIQDTAGWVALRRGDTARAKPLLEGALAQQPDSPAFNYHVGMLYLKERNTAQAKRLLQRALGSGQGFQGMEEAKKQLAKLD